MFDLVEKQSSISMDKKNPIHPNSLVKKTSKNLGIRRKIEFFIQLGTKAQTSLPPFGKMSPDNYGQPRIPDTFGVGENVGRKRTP